MRAFASVAVTADGTEIDRFSAVLVEQARPLERG